jgi:carboxylesterase
VPILQGAEPFSASGDGHNGRVGVLISHGFTGMPASVRPWAEFLADQGYRVEVPLLPGHGTSWQDMNTTRWSDWYATITDHFQQLRAECDQVFVLGLSMGGALVTKLAEDYASDVAGVVLVNPAYATMRRDAKLAKYVARVSSSRPGLGSDIKKPRVGEPGYDRTPLRAFVSLQKLWTTVVADLAKVTAPVLFYHSSEDHVVDELSGRLLHAGATATTVQEVMLTDSYHVATLDNDAPEIFQGSLDFIRRHTRTEQSAT